MDSAAGDAQSGLTHHERYGLAMRANKSRCVTVLVVILLVNAREASDTEGTKAQDIAKAHVINVGRHPAAIESKAQHISSNGS